MQGVYSYKFKVDAQTFRRTLYFNTFAKARFQLPVVLAVWVFGLGLCAANLFFGQEMSNVMRMCYLVICASTPLLVFSCERGWRRYRDSGLDARERRVDLSNDWVKLRISGDPESEKLEWRQISAVFELKDRFVIYRDADLMVVLPKSAIPAGQLDRVRQFFWDNLGRGFHLRCHVASPDAGGSAA